MWRQKEFIEERSSSIEIGTSVIGSAMYADDIVILSQGANDLQHSLNNIYNYCKNMAIKC